MAHRRFVDGSGVSWDVWEVQPRHVERRVGRDRRQLSVDDPRVDPPVLEQRRGVERRRTAGHDAPFVSMRDVLSDGWLTFDSGRERRRLTPVPTTWETASPAELALLCARATIATGARPSAE